MTIARFFLMTLKFNKLLKNVRTNTVKMSPISQFEKFTRGVGEGDKCSHVDEEKYKQIFCFPR